MNHPALTTVLALLAFTICSGLHAQNQTQPPSQIQPQNQTQTQLAPPPLGPLVSYQYWPTQYVQFITGPELPLSLFELDVDASGKQPIYHAVLTGKDGTRTHYSNTDALVGRYKQQGEPSFKTSFAVDSDESEKPGSITTARFSTADGKPVEFRFVQGSDVSEQGSGMQPLPQSPVPVFAYREQGAVAGEGTALKLGETVSTAEVWTEISRPPYFVGYRGAVTSGAHLIVLPRLQETWTVAQAPTSLTAGSAWEMDSSRGNHLSLRIDRADGSRVSLTGTDRFHPDQHITVEASRNGDTWTTSRVLYTPNLKGGEKHTVTLSFTPGLSVTPTEGTMELSIGKKTRLAVASLQSAGEANDRTTQVRFTLPPWAASKSITEEVRSTGNTLVLLAR